MTQVIRSQWSSPKTRVTHTCCKAIGSGAVTNCFYDLGLSRQEFEHPTFHTNGWKCSNQLCHCGGFYVKNQQLHLTDGIFFIPISRKMLYHFNWKKSLLFISMVNVIDKKSNFQLNVYLFTFVELSLYVGAQCSWIFGGHPCL